MLDITIPQKGFTTKELVMTALFTALTVVCAWISIPIGTIAITLQTFAVFCVLLTLGGRDGLFSCLAYILLGAIGLPVFTGFKGGLGVLVGPTGGYILGFMLMALIYWAGTKLLGKKLAVQIILLLAGLAVCYTFGTLWFVYGYSDNGSTIAFIKAAKICVIPFVPFDLLKLVLALILSDRVKKYAKI
ncbi:biotin transporter BioY [Ruminococcus sp.]|uniref:biotin transporter BioY n=1 Tax=Ruminococcus sp. TaxID=41978 RepID=UPI001B4A2B86|nr:biotin transporter BioY [Ruminococcus sp.]MBP5431480.1 biotin transporter BioY [Ruminococcus sp.]